MMALNETASMLAGCSGAAAAAPHLRARCAHQRSCSIHVHVTVGRQAAHDHTVSAQLLAGGHVVKHHLGEAAVQA